MSRIALFYTSCSLQEARTTISRLSAHNARSVGWEMHITQQMEEKQDMWQERDSKCHRTKLAEPEVAAFVNRCSKTAERRTRPATGTSTCMHATSRTPALVQGLSRRRSSSGRVPHLRPSPVCRLRRPSMPHTPRHSHTRLAPTSF